jgi:Zn-dependent M28 family amino/carboxypeptidase
LIALLCFAPKQPVEKCFSSLKEYLKLRYLLIHNFAFCLLLLPYRNLMENKMKKNFLVLFLVFSFVFSAGAQTATKAKSPAWTAAQTITAKQMSEYLYFIASDEMEGRDTPSRGLDTTAKFIALNLTRWGFKPAGDDGTFFQKIALHRDAVDPQGTKLNIGGKDFVYGDDFFRLGGSGTASGTVVFAGDGWLVKSKNIDAYAGVDVSGKIVVLYTEGNPGFRTLTPLPKGVTAADLKPEGRGTDWADPVTYARQKGAAGIILIGSPQAQTNWEQVKGFSSRGATYPEKLRAGSAGNQNTLPVMIVSSATGDAILAGESGTRSSTTAFAINKTVTLAAAAKSQTLWTQNVVAVWEGSDPLLKSEMVAIGAHYDHLGTNPNLKGDDKIYNGADDDGSGTAAVLSMAEALAKSPKRPKRSVLLVWHCGEEKGLWGSEYFTKFPTVDISKVVAQLNIDMIGRSRKADDTNPKNKDLSGENAIYVIGSEMMSSTLGTVVKTTNDTFLKLTYDYRYDDTKDPNRFFFRSDHFNYALRGIPITFWFDGVHEDYHQVGDEPQKIDYNKMQNVGRTIFLTMWELADMKDRPKVDKQLPPELTQR